MNEDIHDNVSPRVRDAQARRGDRPAARNPRFRLGNDAKLCCHFRQEGQVELWVDNALIDPGLLAAGGTGAHRAARVAAAALLQLAAGETSPALIEHFARQFLDDLQPDDRRTFTAGRVRTWVRETR